MDNKYTFEKLPYLVDQLSRKVENLRELFLEYADKESALNSYKPLNIEEAAEFLNLKIPTIYSKVSRGELPYMKQGKRLYFSSEDLIEYLRKGRKLTNDEIYEEASTYLKNKGGNHV